MTTIGSLPGVGGVFPKPEIGKPTNKTFEKQDISEVLTRKSAADEFLEFMQMSPAEKIRALIVGEMGLTEEEIQAMSPEEREKIEAKIAERIKQRMEQEIEKKTGATVSLSGNLTSFSV